MNPWLRNPVRVVHYNDVIMGAMASQITSLTIVYSTVYSGTDQRKHQSSASLAFVWGIHRWPVNSPHKAPVTRKMFPFDDVIMCTLFALKDIHGLKLVLEMKILSTSMKLVIGGCQRIPLMISQHCHRKWLGAVRQLVITRAILDQISFAICRHWTTAS